MCQDDYLSWSSASQVFVVRQLPRRQEPQITGMGPTRLSEVRLSQAAVYDS